MIQFRTSNPKRRRSLSFLTSPDEQDALLRQLETKTWIDEVFNRTVPIPPEYETRFGPQGFSKNPFYSSKKRVTTFFEYGYWLLKWPSLIDKGVHAVCFEVTFKGHQKPLEVSQVPEANFILNPISYQEAHNWVRKINPIPEAIQYPSVREPAGGGINFCIYERHAIAATKAEIEETIMTPKTDGTIHVQGTTRSRNDVIKPIR